MLFIIYNLLILTNIHGAASLSSKTSLVARDLGNTRFAFLIFHLVWSLWVSRQCSKTLKRGRQQDISRDPPHKKQCNASSQLQNISILSHQKSYLKLKQLHALQVKWLLSQYASQQIWQVVSTHSVYGALTRILIPMSSGEFDDNEDCVLAKYSTSAFSSRY